MSRRSPTLHGSAPQRARVVLLLIDVINDMEFPEGCRLMKYAWPAAKRIAVLRKRAKRSGVPIIYVNDNFGRWQSDFRNQVRHCLKDGVRGQRISEILQPDEEDYFVLKPKHSGFFSTTLDILLEYIGAETLILAGIAGNICVLYTANDAYMRDFRIIVPADCIASERPSLNAAALQQMKRYLKAEVCPGNRIDFNKYA